MIRDASYRLLLLSVTTTIGICIMLPLIHVMPVHAHALADPITIDSRNSTLNFPQSIDFEVKAHDDQATLTQATLYMKYNDSLSFTPQQSIPAPTQEHNETFFWQDNLARNADTFPPAGTWISYYWTIRDSNGNTHTDSIQTFEVIDNRFQWQHLSQGFYQVNWYNQPNSFGETILNQVTTNGQRISNNLGGGPQKQINLWIYTSEEDFKGSLPPGTYEWVGGIAFPLINQASIVVTDPTDITLSRDMPHEIAHLIFHQRTLLGIAPIWFNEGIAVYNQIYHEPAMNIHFNEALTTHSLLQLAAISRSFPVDANTAYLAYAESWKLLDYMYKTFGQSKMHTLFQAMDSRSNTFNGDLQQVLGLDIAHIENQWHLSLGQPATLTQTQDTTLTTSIVTSNTTRRLMMVLGIALVLIPLLILGAWLAYQRRTQQKTRLQPQRQEQPSPIAPYAPFPNQGTPWYPSINSYLSYRQPLQTSQTIPNVHTGNYTSPEAYTVPTIQNPPGQVFSTSGMPAHNIPQNTQGQHYSWYPPYPPQSSHPSRSQTPQE